MADPTPKPEPKYVVVVPLVITKKLDGSDLYIYDGGVLPAFVKADEVDRLLAEKYVAKLDGASTPIAESN